MSIEKRINKSILVLKKGDITVEDTEAVVNAANKALTPGGGVSGAIHRAAGPGLWDEAKGIGGCGTGEARITDGHGLEARYVIHTVGPVFGGKESDSKDLEKSYKSSLELALKNKIKSISFPSISTGIFGYPVAEASKIALRTIIDFLEQHPEIELVKMVLFSDSDYHTYKDSLEELL